MNINDMTNIYVTMLVQLQGSEKKINEHKSYDQHLSNDVSLTSRFRFVTISQFSTSLSSDCSESW